MTQLVTALLILTGYAMLILTGYAMLFAVSEWRYRVNRSRRIAARLERRRRKDVAWQRWCDVASLAVSAGAPVPPWEEPP